MDKATQTMVQNLRIKTGKTLEQWAEIARNTNISKHGEIIKFLKDKHGLTYGYANLIAHRSRGAEEGPADDQSDLIAAQYHGKENHKLVYDKLMQIISNFGTDIEIAPKKTYVSLRRKKQFATLNPATKTRFEIGINLKGQESMGKLVAEKPNSMCSHKICLAGLADLDDEVINWIKTAYDNAG